MPFRRRLTGEADPRRFYAFVDSIHDPEPDYGRARLSLQFDAVDANTFDSRASLETDQGFALLRIQTTRGRLNSLGIGVPTEGEWIKVTIEKREGMPRAWIAPADRNFVPDRVLNAPTLTRLDGGDDNNSMKRLLAFCSAPEAKHIKAEQLARRLDLANRRNLKITALDVGQASCVTFSEGSRDFGYFDVGKPLSFNRRSFPKNFAHSYASEGFVLLSHWDFDHFALAINNPSLMMLDWYAPKQDVGPFTAKFQKRLGPRLHFISGDAATAEIRLARCLGTDPKNRNATGYVLRFERRDEAVVLTGDADYLWIPDNLKARATAIMMPHHGGKGTLPPRPAKGNVAIAVASYGKPNCYKHPDDAQLAAHRSRGWRLRRTAAHNGMPRAEKQLFPLGQSVQRPSQHRQTAFELV